MSKHQDVVSGGTVQNSKGYVTQYGHQNFLPTLTLNDQLNLNLIINTCKYSERIQMDLLFSQVRVRSSVFVFINFWINFDRININVCECLMLEQYLHISFV